MAVTLTAAPHATVALRPRFDPLVSLRTGRRQPFQEVWAE